MNIFKVLWLLKTQFLRLSIRKIGLLSYIANPIFIYGGRRILIGNRVRILPGVRLETHNRGFIIIKDDVSIGQNFHVTSGEIDLIIGEHSTILGNVFVTNIDHDYSIYGTHILKQKHIIKRTTIGKNCFIGYGACIQAGTILGDNCVVGANSVVRGTFPDGSVIVGAPGRIVKMYNTVTKNWEKYKND